MKPTITELLVIFVVVLQAVIVFEAYKISKLEAQNANLRAILIALPLDQRDIRGNK